MCASESVRVFCVSPSDTMATCLTMTPSLPPTGCDIDVDALMSATCESAVPTRWERKQSQLHNPHKLQLNTTSTSFGSPSQHIHEPTTPSPSASTLFQPKTPTGRTPSRVAGAGLSKTPKSYTDRFIPTRDSLAKPHPFNNENCPLPPTAPTASSASSPAQLNSHLASSLFSSDELTSKILTFKTKAPRPTESTTNTLHTLYTQHRDTQPHNNTKRSVTHRHIATVPERILDAPNMSDDYYLNLLDWSSSNVLAVALGGEVYLWDASTGSIDLLCEMATPGDVVTSVQWMADGAHIAIGTNNATSDILLWDVAHKKQKRVLRGHEARVSALAWNGAVLSSAGRDTVILHHDVRQKQAVVGSGRGAHVQEICGLKWNAEGTQLASGGNDNLACIWDLSSSAQQQPRFTLSDASAAVKALAWCPFQRNTLATGAGTADRHIRFYNSSTGALLNSIDTQSQVTSLQWSQTERELLSSHGFSRNQLCVWKYPTLVKVAELEGHTSRVLHTSVSADGSCVVSGAADETLRFWKVWEPRSAAGKKEVSAVGSVTGGPRRSGLGMSMR